MMVRLCFRFLFVVWSTSYASAQGATGVLMLPAGTAVLVRTEENLSGDTVHEGQQVPLVSRGLVQHDREILIPYHSVGNATVRQVHGTGLFNTWKRFSISLEDIEAADGTRIELDHSPIPIINGPEQTPIQKSLFNVAILKWGHSQLGHAWLLGHTKSDVRFANPDSFRVPKTCRAVDIGIYAVFGGFSHVNVTVSAKPATASANGSSEAFADLRDIRFGAGEEDIFESPPGELTVKIADQQFAVNLAPCAGVYYRLRKRGGRLEIESVPEEIFVIEAQFLDLRGTNANFMVP